MLRLAHIINPVKVPESSDLYTAQPITFETMRLAAEQAGKGIEVELLTTQYPEDHEVIPGYFRKLRDLQRSVLDVGGPFTQQRKLPLIGDILAVLDEHTQADYVVYTNADIALMPQFYAAAGQMLAQGHDAIIINRRRVSQRYTKPKQIPLMQSELGKPHPGFDCFVFKRELLPQLQCGHICVGVPFIGVCLAHNLFALAQNPLYVYNQHLSIHIGMEVMPPVNKQYYWHNRREFMRIRRQLKPSFDIRKFPYAALPLPKRLLKWGLNPSLSIAMNSELEVKGFWRRFRYRLNELRWRLLSR